MFTVEETWGGVRYLVTHHADPQTIYDELNREFWDGKLPRYVVRFADDDHPLPNVPGEWPLGSCDHKKRLITILATAQMHESVGGLRGVVAHELAHVAAPDDEHGARFQAALRRMTR